jgi:hypothetical protein
LTAAILLCFQLPANAQDPRLAAGILLTFNPSTSALEMRPIANQGQGVILSFAKPPEPFISLMVRDYTMRPGGRLAVSASGILPGHDGTANLILEFDVRDLSRTATVRNTGPVACYVIEATASALWCLGPDMQALLRGGDYPILYRFEDSATEPVPVLKRGEVPRDSGKSPWAGGAQLLSVPDGRVVAWMPGVKRYATVMGDEARVREMPWEPRPHSLVSVAVDTEGRLHALLPLADEEKLDTPYGLFRLQGTRWVRLNENSTVLRGARLLAVDPEVAVLVDRQIRVMTIRVLERTQGEDR